MNEWWVGKGGEDGWNLGGEDKRLVGSCLFFGFAPLGTLLGFCFGFVPQ